MTEGNWCNYKVEGIDKPSLQILPHGGNAAPDFDVLMTGCLKKLNIGLSIAAGLLGGVFSHYIWTQPVQAQNQPSPNQNQLAPKEVRAQSFVVVNDKGEVQGVLTFDEANKGRTSVKLYDSNGREIFSAGGSPMRPLSGALR